MSLILKFFFLQEMESDLKKLQEEKTRLKLELDRVKGELADRQRKYELTEQVSASSNLISTAWLIYIIGKLPE